MILLTSVLRHGTRAVRCEGLRKITLAKMKWQGIRRFLAAEDGPTAVEYAVMLMLIFAACLLAVNLVGQKTLGSFSTSANSINKAITSAS